jgi:hypothetical protein
MPYSNNATNDTGWQQAFVVDSALTDVQVSRIIHHFLRNIDDVPEP